MTLRAEMGVSFHSTGCAKSTEKCWDESCTINRSPRRATKDPRKPAGVTGGLSLWSESYSALA
jgi:hypothetical protein